MTRVWAPWVSRSIADWASRVSAVIPSHSTATGIRSFWPNPLLTWLFRRSACLGDFEVG